MTTLSGSTPPPHLSCTFTRKPQLLAASLRGGKPRTTHLDAGDCEVGDLEVDADGREAARLHLLSCHRRQGKPAAHEKLPAPREVLDAPEHGVLLRHIHCAALHTRLQSAPCGWSHAALGCACCMPLSRRPAQALTGTMDMAGWLLESLRIPHRQLHAPAADQGSPGGPDQLYML